MLNKRTSLPTSSHENIIVDMPWSIKSQYDKPVSRSPPSIPASTYVDARMFANSSFLLTVWCKIGMLFLHPSSTITLFMQLPGFIFLDGLALCLLYYLSQSSLSLVAITCSLVQVILSNTIYYYYMETSSFIDWLLLTDILQMMTESVDLLGDYVLWIVYSSTASLCVMGLISLPKIARMIVDGIVSMDILCSRHSLHFTRFKKVIGYSMIFICFIEYAAMDSSYFTRRISENVLLTPLWKWTRRLYFMSLQSTPTASFTFTKHAYPHHSQTIPNMTNVVILSIESLRKDLVQHDPNSILSRYGIPKTRQVTPFLQHLRTRSLYFEHRSTSAYTLKSFLSSVCGVYPLAGYLVEHEKHVYAECLPRLFKLFYGPESTSLFQTPSTMKFDSGAELLAAMGFDEKEDVFDLNIPRDAWLNYAGAQDEDVFEPMMDALSRLHAKQTPFVYSYMTNANHHPFTVPPSFKRNYTFYAPHSTLNNYLNTQAYVDQFLSRVFDRLNRDMPDLMQRTLFVIMGDHGVAMGDHGMYGSSQTLFEEGYQVPLYFYSEHPQFQARVSYFKTPDVPSQNVDILPTIIDLLDVSVNKSVLLQSYEGLSLIQPDFHEMSLNRRYFSLSNPFNDHGIILVQNGLKATFNIRSLEYGMYDLTVDPYEKYSTALTLKLSPSRHSVWFERAKRWIIDWKAHVERKWNIANVTHEIILDKSRIPKEKLFD